MKLKAFFLHLNDGDSSDDAPEKKSRSALRYACAARVRVMRAVFTHTLSSHHRLSLYDACKEVERSGKAIADIVNTLSTCTGRDLLASSSITSQLCCTTRGALLY